MLSLLVLFYVALFYSLLHIIFRESLSRSVLCLIDLYLIIQWYLFYLLVVVLVIDGCYHQIFFFLIVGIIKSFSSWCYHQLMVGFIKVFLPSMSFYHQCLFYHQSLFYHQGLLPSRSFLDSLLRCFWMVICLAKLPYVLYRVLHFV